MKKTAKKIFTSIFLALCLVVSLFAITACGDNNSNNGGGNDDEITYTVSVMKDATTPANGVMVQLQQGGNGVDLAYTDANGKATFKTVPGDYTVELDKLPAHYHVPTDATLTLSAEKPNLTITLAENFTYKVTLLKLDGTPFYAEGVEVGLCTDDNCFPTLPLEKDGTVTFERDPGDYYVQILNLPANVEFDRIIEKPTYYSGDKFSATHTRMTIPISVTSSYEIDLTGTPMTDTAKTAFATKYPSTGYDSDAQTFKAYSTSQEIAPGEVATFSVTPTFSGTYHYYTNSSKNLQYEAVSDNKIFIAECNYVAGKTYAFTVTNTSSEKAYAEFVLTIPYSTYLDIDSEGQYDLTVGKANTCAVLAFIPTETGNYALTLPSGAIAKVFNSQPSEIISNTDDWSASVTVQVAPNDVFRPLYFAVTVADTTYPAVLKVTLTKSTIVEEDVAITASLTQQTKPAGQELTGIPLTKAAEDQLTLNPTSCYWEYNGKTVYVKLDRSSRHELALAYMDRTSAQFSYVFTTAGSTAIKDYRVFLRGFKDYEYPEGSRTPAIPSEIPTETYYVKFVNEDGAYPLTDELKIFLELFYQNNARLLNHGLGHTEGNDETVYDGYWLFPCYFYEDAEPADPIVGQYGFLSKTNWEGKIKLGDPKNPMGDKYTADDFVLTVERDNTFSISGDGNLLSGTWSKSGNTYTFTAKGGAWDKSGEDWVKVDLTYTVTFENGNIKLVAGNTDGDNEFEVTEWEFGTAPVNED